MAGIGFELKKLFRQGSVFSSLRGVFYASMTTIGPLIMIIAALFAMYGFLDYSSLELISRDLLSSTVLYIFIFALIGTSPVNSVLSRYIADKIYEEKEEDVLPSYYIGLYINTALTAVLGVPFAIFEVFYGNIDPLYVLASYCMYTALAFVFFNMIYISAIKEYKKITFSFVIGLVVAFIAAYLLVTQFKVGLSEAIIYAFAFGFTLIAVLLFALVKSFFKENSGNYKEPLSYFKKHKLLLFANLLYTLGLYSHNFIMWASPLKIVVANCFISAPVYDMATCIAMFMNISTLVIFIVQVETNFHDEYTKYCQAIIGGTSRDIATAKTDMLKMLSDKLSFVFQLQLLINVILYLLEIIFLPRFGIGGIILDILPSLAVAYFAIFIMYCLIVFMYYFEDAKGALITSLLFLTVTTAGTLISMHLQPSLYGLGLFIGAMVAFAYSYFRLRHVSKNLEHHIFCKGTIIPKKILDEPKKAKQTAAKTSEGV